MDCLSAILCFDLAVVSIDPELVSPDIPVLPLEIDSDAASVGKTVVSMGYPNGPDRLLAMVDDAEAKSRDTDRCCGTVTSVTNMATRNVEKADRYSLLISMCSVARRSTVSI